MQVEEDLRRLSTESRRKFPEVKKVSILGVRERPWEQAAEMAILTLTHHHDGGWFFSLLTLPELWNSGTSALHSDKVLLVRILVIGNFGVYFFSL